MIHGEQKISETDEVDGRNSPPNVPKTRMSDVSGGFPAHPAKEKPPINVVGDVGGRIAIMVDDLIDDVESFVSAAEVLKERGAYKIYVLATHGLLSSDAPRLIEDSAIDEVIYTHLIVIILKLNLFFNSRLLSLIQFLMRSRRCNVIKSKL